MPPSRSAWSGPSVSQKRWKTLRWFHTHQAVEAQAAAMASSSSATSPTAPSSPPSSLPADSASRSVALMAVITSGATSRVRSASAACPAISGSRSRQRRSDGAVEADVGVERTRSATRLTHP